MLVVPVRWSGTGHIGRYLLALSERNLRRAGQPNEVAPCYVFLASEDASYMSGQVLHPNGGNVVGS